MTTSARLSFALAGLLALSTVAESQTVKRDESGNFADVEIKHNTGHCDIKDYDKSLGFAKRVECKLKDGSETKKKEVKQPLQTIIDAAKKALQDSNLGPVNAL